MIKQEYKEILAQMPPTQYGVALKALLDEELAALKDIHNCTSWDDTLARQKAAKIIDKIFAFMKDPSQVDKGKSLYE